MKVTIDTDKNIVLVDGDVVYQETQKKPEVKPMKDLAGLFETYEGIKEYNGIVADIQRWYYGSLVKDAWCATSVSYFAHLCGADKVIGKHESVDRMKEYLQKQDRIDCTKNYGGGAYKPQRNDLIFFSSKHTYADCTHVMVVQSVNGAIVKCIGGNTGDAIASRTYNYLTDKYVVAFGNTQM